MAPVAIGVVFAVGLLAGLLSGLVGVGGGVLMVPFLYFFYARPGWSGVAPPPDVATVAAHATSLFVILPTSLRGAWAYHARDLVVWRAVWPIGLSAAVAAALTSRVAAEVEPRWLRLFFAAFLLWNAAHVIRSPKPEGEVEGAEPRALRLSAPVTVGVGAAVGAFSALLGVGGGLVAIPLMIHLVGIELRRVAGTSLAVIALTSLGGTLAYMLAAAPAAPVRAGWSLGFVDLLAALLLTCGTLISVGWGAELNRRLNPRTLSVVFASLFTLIAAQLLFENL